MSRFSVAEVAFTGFRVVRERPRIVLFWILAQLVVSVLMGVLTVVMAGPALTQLQAVRPAPGNPAAAAANLALMAQLAPMYLVVMLVVVAFYAVMYAAMSRAVLRPADDRFGYLRLGADELRQLGLFLLMLLVGIAAYVVFLIAIIVLAAIGAMVARGTGAGGWVGPVVVGLLMVLLMLAAFCAWIFFWIRLSLASPLTFAKGKIDLFGSWRLTRGLFWPMLGAYLLAFAAFFAMSLLYFAILAAVATALGGGAPGLAALLHPNMSSLSAYLTPVVIVSQLLGAIFFGCMLPVFLTPPVAIYQRLNTDWVDGVF